MTYSIDFREAVLAHIDTGASIESTSTLFSIGTTTIKNWKRLRAATGKLAGSGRPCSPYKIDSDKLKAYVKDHPDAFLNEIAERFGVTSPAIHAAMKRLNITRKKKSLLYKERSEEKRQNYLDIIEPINPEDLIFVDESGIDSFLHREYARSERGVPVLAEKSGKRFARESFVAGLHNNKVVTPICYQGTMDSALFNFWLSSFLLPEIGKGKTVIMDNAAFHKSQETETIINDAGCELIFLPPYSPDFNPIEKFWANLKRFIRNTISQFDKLQDAIDNAFQGIV